MIINASAHQIPLAGKSVHAIVTSPPYFGLRAYSGNQAVDWPAGIYSPCTGAPPCIEVPEMRCGFGTEQSVEAYIWHSLLILRECRRVLRDDGVLWWNLGDSYAGSWGNYGGQNRGNGSQREITVGSLPTQGWDGRERERPAATKIGLPQGDLLGIPHRLILAAQADGWLIRNDCIWGKVAPMPESVKGWRFQDGKLGQGSWRHTRAHEFVFQMVKQMGYWSDGEAVKESIKESSKARYSQSTPMTITGQFKGSPIDKRFKDEGKKLNGATLPSNRNPRSVLQPPPSSYSGAHFAVFPPELIRPLILSSVPRRSCVRCGMGWAPTIERKTCDPASYNGSRFTAGKTAKDNTGQGDRYETQLSDYRPSCDCGTEEWKPGVVLDPFTGSGTTGEVARESLVDFIGLDISFEYLTDQAAWRAERQVSAREIEKMPLFAGCE